MSTEQLGRMMGSWFKEGYPDFKLQFNTTTTGAGNWQLFSWCPHGPVPFEFTGNTISIDLPKWPGETIFTYGIDLWLPIAAAAAAAAAAARAARASPTCPSIHAPMHACRHASSHTCVRSSILPCMRADSDEDKLIEDWPVSRGPKPGGTINPCCM